MSVVTALFLMDCCCLFLFYLKMLLVITNHWKVIPAVCRLHVHLCCPTSHHTLCPRSYWSTPPLVPPALCDLPQASHQYCCRLNQNNTNQCITIPSVNNEGLTGSITVHFISATNTVLKAITHMRFWDATPTKSTNPPKWAGNLPTFTACVQKIAFSWN